ncbi:MAG: RNA polymerase factor sigma-54 [Campylobacterales bacterium]|nr:RNA polymerase factor sigma-54 [Campylobacterales bacterium]
MYKNELNLKLQQNLQLSLKMWLPILQSSLSELDKTILEQSDSNPFIDVKSKFEEAQNFKTVHGSFQYDNFDYRSNIDRDGIEQMTISKKSLYETLNDQIEYPLFPTPISQQIAFEIIENINDLDFYEGESQLIAKKFNVKVEDVEKIRLRFAYLDPIGVGAKDFKESFMFQLNELNIEDDDLYKFVLKLIADFENIYKYSKSRFFEDAIKIIKKFRNPPALEYQAPLTNIIVDAFVFFDNEEDGELRISINGKYYPEIVIKDTNKEEKDDFVKEKLKDAKNLVNLLSLRKATLYKLILAIVEEQYRFFCGGEMVPLRLQDIAEKLGFNESTISRAVANKYLACDRGIFSMKDFFTHGIEDKISSNEIKNYMKNIILYEEKEKPLEDEQILELVQKRFSISMVRRSITKYRQELNIGSSKERKKLYKLLQDSSL